MGRAKAKSGGPAGGPASAQSSGGRVAKRGASKRGASKHGAPLAGLQTTPQPDLETVAAEKRQLEQQVAELKQQVADSQVAEASGQSEINVPTLSLENTSLPTVSPFISISNEPNAHVIPSVKSKVAKGEYVDLAYMLEGATDVNETQNAYSLNVSLTDDPAKGNVFIRSPGPKRKIDTIAQWTDAFIVYAYTFLKAHPERERELLVYMRTVRRASTYAGNWKLYDQQFRLKRQNDPSLSFASIDTELWLVYVVGGKTTQGNIRSTTNNQQGSIGGDTKSYGSRDSNACWGFNRPAGCVRPVGTCRFRHECTKCKKTNHGAHKCFSENPN